MAATVRLVTGGERQRWAWVRRAVARAAAGVRAAGLIVAGLGSFVWAAFEVHRVAGIVVLGLSLLVLDWSRRPDHRGQPSAQGPP